ncbi:MAG: hypothetical protein FJX56_06700 [Alphaproteobacteria bacterium]|nr:hypothetical protein [Alphaproteobacteria bacterium]
MERWNYYFEQCQGITVTGATVRLPAGLGIVTSGEKVDCDQVLFPAGQRHFDLIIGEVERLARLGFAKRYGKLR